MEKTKYKYSNKERIIITLIFFSLLFFSMSPYFTKNISGDWRVSLISDICCLVMVIYYYTYKIILSDEFVEIHSFGKIKCIHFSNIYSLGHSQYGLHLILSKKKALCNLFSLYSRVVISKNLKNYKELEKIIISKVEGK